MDERSPEFNGSDDMVKSTCRESSFLTSGHSSCLVISGFIFCLLMLSQAGKFPLHPAGYPPKSH